MKKNVLCSVLALALALFICKVAFCQEATTTPAAAPAPAVAAATATDEPDYTYGYVKEVTDKQITIEEYNYDEETLENNVYELGDKVEFVNIKAANELKVGDPVGIDFITKDDKNVAVTITLETEEGGEEA